jgi:outer membrane protein
MRRGLFAAAIAAALAAAPAARAEPVIALRLGVGAAVGSAVADVPVSDTIPLQFPLQLDALWREGPIAGGIYGSWAPATAGRCGGASCSAHVTRLGLQGTWTFARGDGGEPWAGLASGYEWATEERTQGSTVATSWRGFELLAAQGGIEWRLGRWVALGPYALASVGRYAHVSVDTGIESASQAVPSTAIHGWFQLGVRGRLVLGEKTP